MQDSEVVYEYRCSQCDARFEVPFRMEDVNFIPLCECGCVDFKRVYSFGISWPKSERGH